MTKKNRKTARKLSGEGMDATRSTTSTPRDQGVFTKRKGAVHHLRDRIFHKANVLTDEGESSATPKEETNHDTPTGTEVDKGQSVESEAAALDLNHGFPDANKHGQSTAAVLRDAHTVGPDPGATAADEDNGSTVMPEDISVNSLAYAAGLGLNKTKQCMEGTRTEILAEIFDWIDDTDVTTPRIFWLHGQTGKGKSTIAHTIALQAQNRGILASCFYFTRFRQNEKLHVKLFPTVARDLAQNVPGMKSLLEAMISSNPSLRDTEDIAEQWKKFIIEPLSQLENPMTGNILVVIDDLDESGVEATREHILGALTAHGAELPPYMRILLTSRPLNDISEALGKGQHIRTRSLDGPLTEATSRDIHLFLSMKVKKYANTLRDGDIDKVVAKSDGVFEWARLAGEFIRTGFGITPREHLLEVLDQKPGNGRTLLDEMYTLSLKDLLRGEPIIVVRFRSVMRQVIYSKEPLSISALTHMRAKFPDKDERYNAGIILDFMPGFLSGIKDHSTPIFPLHVSLYDFLTDEMQGGEFFVGKPEEIHHDLALASFCVMQTGLQFNICGLESSYVPNSVVLDLSKRVQKNIPLQLSYSCQFWAAHLVEAGFHLDLAQAVRVFVMQEQIILWLEVLGLLKLVNKTYEVLASAEKWLQGKPQYDDVQMLIKDVVKLVQNFAGIINDSTPHLYLSALPFLPSKSLLATGLHSKFENIAQVAVGQQEYWPRNPHTLQQHSAWVTSVAFSLDGRYMVSGSSDKTVQLWNAHTNSQLGSPLQGHTGLVTSVAFSPNGRHIVSGSTDKTIQCWDVKTSVKVGGPLQGHTGAVTSVAFSPDGKYIVSSSCDHTIQLWDAKTGTQAGNPFQGHTKSVQSVAFSQDGRYIVSGSNDCTVRLWDVQTGSQLGKPLQGPLDAFLSVAISPNGKHIVSGSFDHLIQIWDTHTGIKLGNPLQGHAGPVNSVAFSPNGRHIASASSDNTIQLWDVRTGAQVGQALLGYAFSVAFSPDGRHIVSGSYNNTIHVWKMNIIAGMDMGPAICFSTAVSHALQDVKQLSIGVAEKRPTSVQQGLVTHQRDGWIVGPNGQLLLWVPLLYFPLFFYTPWASLVAPKGLCELDLSKMAHGSGWNQCFTGSAQDA